MSLCCWALLFCVTYALIASHFSSHRPLVDQSSASYPWRYATLSRVFAYPSQASRWGAQTLVPLSILPSRFFDCFQILEVYRDTMPVLNRTPAIVIGNMDIRVATVLCSSSMRWEVMLHVPTLRHLLEERKLALLQPLGVWHNALGHGAEQRYL